MRVINVNKLKNSNPIECVFIVWTILFKDHRRGIERRSHVFQDIGRRFVKFFPYISYISVVCGVWQHGISFDKTMRGGRRARQRETIVVSIRAWKVPHATCFDARVERHAVDVSRNFSRNVYTYIPFRMHVVLTLHNIREGSYEKSASEDCAELFARNIDRSTRFMRV